MPSGASTGRHEAVELRDGDPTRYGGKGVRKAVANVRDILTAASARHGRRPTRPASTASSASSTARRTNRASAPTPSWASRWPCAHAAAASRGVPLWRYLDADGLARLPLPMVNLISGGLHAGGNLDFQDFLLLPIGARSYSEALEMTRRRLPGPGATC